ncbi:glutathione peroxidase [Psychromonas sp. 14N.309.X.WAT.B.A12]|uniref:glutathione peroxidase n=1 Tax=unclassified Psychromonas TaxID=2614957 RepID=UPI0025B0A607|nr:glutathione peroxidase [Psychromonas sp. 14N.309.X.WAT.B.A12]MDN2664012.1 glutathione peroxidase [Psychromonas sp. 14N.309.X.WAT.B.A12]
MLDNIEGQHVPNVTFPTRQGDEWVNITTDQLFKNKTVVVFALPGAFTPTCSSTHLPRYNELAAVLKENGVDEVVCLSVNDTFVMNAWLADQEADHITVVPDGSGEFTEGMGMLVNKNDIGFGKRSWRYSMLVKDGVIDKMFIEPNQPGDPFEVSDADTMLNYINPNAKAPSAVALLTKPGCPFCEKAKAALKDNSIKFEEIVLGKDATSVALKAMSGQTTVPQIFVDGKHLGDSDAAVAYANS